MGKTFKPGQVFKGNRCVWEVDSVDLNKVTVRSTPGGRIIGLPKIVINSVLGHAKYLGESRKPLIGDVFEHRLSKELAHIVALPGGSDKIQLAKMGSYDTFYTYGYYFALLEDFEYLGAMPKVGDVFEKNGWRAKITIVGNTECESVIVNESWNGLKSSIPIGSLLRNCKKVESAAELPTPKRNSVFLDPKTEEVFCYTPNSKARQHVLRNLKTGVNYISHRKEMLKGLQLLGSMPQVGEVYGKDGVSFEIVDLDKDKAYVVWPLAADKRKVPMLIRNVLQDYKKITPSNPDLRPIFDLDISFPVKPFEDAANLLQKFGKAIRGLKGECFVLDYAMSDVEAEHFLRTGEVLPRPSLFPQVGDVYASKFNGIEVAVIKVRRTGYTVSDGRRKWKVNSQALGINYKWVR